MVAFGWALKISKKKSTDIKSDNDDNVDGEGVKDDDASDMASCQGKAKRIMQGARRQDSKEDMHKNKHTQRENKRERERDTENLKQQSCLTSLTHSPSSVRMMPPVGANNTRNCQLCNVTQCLL